MATTRIKENVRKCVTCKHWYDPANQFIKPCRMPGYWEYDRQARSKCLLTRVEKCSDYCACSKYESRF